MSEFDLDDPSAPRSVRLHRLYDSLVLPLGTYGHLDWVTGLILINSKRSEAQRLFRTGDGPEQLLLALDHETYHGLQVATLGYLYKMIIFLRIAVNETVRGAKTSGRASYDRIFEIIEKGFDFGWYNVVRNAIGDLQRKPNDGVSSLEIVEAVTYCSQYGDMIKWKSSAYEEFLRDEDAGPEYTRAYEWFKDRVSIGLYHEPLQAFPISAHLALCSSSPPECLAILADAFRERSLSMKTPLSEIIKFCRNCDPNYLGFSWEVMDMLGQPLPKHPVFGKIREIFYSEAGNERLFKYLYKPSTIDLRTRIERVARYVLLKPGLDRVDENFRRWSVMTFGGIDHDEVPAMILQCAVGRALIGTVSIPLIKGGASGANFM